MLVLHSVNNAQLSSSSTVLAVVILLTYGACHAAAWNTHFPSLAEAWFWRVSSIVVAIVPCYFILIFFGCRKGMLVANLVIQPCTFCFLKIGLAVDQLIPSFNPYGYYWAYFGYVGEHIDRLILMGILGVVIFGRIFLLVESFISLRSLPEGSFNTTFWENYWPHL